jgi:hypothetical protein
MPRSLESIDRASTDATERLAQLSSQLTLAVEEHRIALAHAALGIGPRARADELALQVAEITRERDLLETTLRGFSPIRQQAADEAAALERARLVSEAERTKAVVREHRVKLTGLLTEASAVLADLLEAETAAHLAQNQAWPGTSSLHTTRAHIADFCLQMLEGPDPRRPLVPRAFAYRNRPLIDDEPTEEQEN